MVWGNNHRGQLGLNHEDDIPMPTMHPFFFAKKVVQVASGVAHTIIVMEGGGAMSFGANDKGQLGTGDCEDASIPVFVQTIVRSGARKHYKGMCPTPEILVKNLEAYTTERSMIERYSQFFGYKSLLFRNADYSKGDPRFEMAARPSCIVYFDDAMDASTAMMETHDQVLGFWGGQDYLTNRLQVSFNLNPKL